ncbi:MAG: metallophosphoesterase [Thermodesulfobacteriota bacterium]
MNFEELIDRASRIFEKESRLIHLPREGKVVFVGDTHGDLDASEKVLHKYLKESYRIIFLGDYVDRGEESEANINYLLQMKIEHPEQIFLLSGNHEGFMVKEHYPADFWESLSFERRRQYGMVFSKLPFCATADNGILALHGGLPDLETIDAINQIALGSEQWDRIVWGDFVERESGFLGNFWGRPQFGLIYFEQLMERYQKRVLIRSHQPHAPLMMFKKRCITIFTSYAYLPIRTIVVADLEKEIQDAEDISIERI